MGEGLGEKAVLRDAVRALAAEARSVEKDHPMPDELVDYQAGDLNQKERARIQDHLAVCPDCARAVLEMDAFPDVGVLPAAVRPSGRDLAAAWERFQDRTGPRWPARRRPFRVPVPRYGLAAALALAILALAFHSGRLWEGSARGALQVVDLLPPGDAVRSASPGPGEGAVRLEPWARGLVLLLPLGAAEGEEGEARPAHEVVITAADGRERWREGGLHGGPDGTLVLVVPRRLPPGAYRVRLYDAAALGRPAEAEYELVLAG
jgi:hypothetical protein